MREDYVKMKKRGIMIGVAAALVIGGVSACTSEDPKTTVINAFEDVYAEGQTQPLEELLGFSQFSENNNSDSEAGFSVKLDSCSDESVNALAGLGVRMAAMNDGTNGKSSVDMGVVYNGMDVATLNAYYADKTLMAAVPELSSKVFTLDLSEGLEDRIMESPVLGPLLTSYDVDLEEIMGSLNEIVEEAEANGGQTEFDIAALMNRFKEGCKAQENFKAALTVTKGEKATFTVNGKEENCKGYVVTVSKASMIDFLRESSDFFLQDETLKNDFISYLERTVKMSELMGTTMYSGLSGSAQETQEQMYEEAKKGVDQMIDYLDEALTDVQMNVYVTKSGHLAAFSGTTVLNVKNGAQTENIDVSFDCQIQGGAYHTQNAAAKIECKEGADTLVLDLKKQGTYEGGRLTSDIALDLTIPQNETYNILYTGTYASEGGDYHVSLETGKDGKQLFECSVSGVIDELEKGKSIHITYDELRLSFMEDSENVVLSGDFYYRPLSAEPTPPEGEEMDVIAASEADWNDVMTEVMYKAMGIASQLGIPLN